MDTIISKKEISENGDVIKKVNSILNQYIYDLLNQEEDMLTSDLPETMENLTNHIKTTIKNLISVIEKNDTLSEDIISMIREHNFFESFVLSSKFARHTFEKPYGYAGDMHLMKKICEKDVLGDTHFEKILDNFFLSVPSSEAVRQRAKSLFEILKKLPENSKVLNLACGPALEIQGLLEISDKNIEFVLIDNDPLTLQYLKEQNFDERVKILQANAFKLNSKRLAKLINNQNFDLVYSSGLYDYIPDKFSSRITKALFDQLNKGGKLIIGNFLELSETNPQTKRQRFVMDEILDWKLIYRTPEEIKKFLNDINSEDYNFIVSNEYFATNPNNFIGHIGFLIVNKI